MNYTGHKEYTSKAQGIYNTVSGSAGLASFLGINANNDGCGGGGLLNLGGNRNNCYVTEKENNLSTALAIAQSEKYTSEKSEQNLKELYAETLRLNEIQRGTDAKISDGLIQTGNALGILNAEVACLKESVARNREESFRNLNEAKDYTNTLVKAEENLRKCEDEKVVLWVKAQNYVPGTVKIDPDQICGASPLSSGCCY